MSTMSNLIQNETENRINPPHIQWHILRQAISTPRRFLAIWYIAYLFLGIVTAGMVPVLLPLMMVSVSHELSIVAYVMGAYNLGLLVSPLWGILAERRHEYKILFFAGLLFLGLSVAAMTVISGLAAWFPVAFVIGASASAVATVASLFVVDFTPRPEWEPRIGWLQSFNGVGQMVGLMLAAVFSSRMFDTGLWIAAAFMLPALLVGGIGLPAGLAPTRNDAKREHTVHLIHYLDFRTLAAFPRTNLGIVGILRHSHYLGRSGWSALPKAMRTVFGRFLFSWFGMALGVAAFFAYFPLLMQHGYSVAAGVTSIVYGIAAAIGIPLFVLASRWSSHRGPGLVYRGGLILRITGFALLLVMFFLPVPGKGAVALVGFVLISLAWPILSVTGTGLAANLTTDSEGKAMGMFNASGALATVIGTFASGPLVRFAGYGIIPVLALGGLIAALVLSHGLVETVPTGTISERDKLAGG